MKLRNLIVFIVLTSIIVPFSVGAKGLLVVKKAGNVRSDPIINSTDVGNVSPGDTLEVLGFDKTKPFKSQGWYQSELGWIWAGLAERIPVVESEAAIFEDFDALKHPIVVLPNQIESLGKGKDYSVSGERSMETAASSKKFAKIYLIVILTISAGVCFGLFRATRS